MIYVEIVNQDDAILHITEVDARNLGIRENRDGDLEAMDPCADDHFQEIADTLGFTGFAYCISRTDDEDRDILVKKGLMPRRIADTILYHAYIQRNNICSPEGILLRHILKETEEDDRREMLQNSDKIVDMTTWNETKADRRHRVRRKKAT